MNKWRSKSARKQKYTFENSGPSCFRIEIKPESAEKNVGEIPRAATIVSQCVLMGFRKKEKLENEGWLEGRPEGRLNVAALAASTWGGIFFRILLIYGRFLIGVYQWKGKIASFLNLQEKLDNSEEIGVEKLVEDVGESWVKNGAVVNFCSARSITEW